MVRVVATDADRNRTISYSIEGFRNITKLVGIDKARYLVPGCCYFYADFRNSLHNSGSEETFPPSGQIVVAGKVDREILPWLNFTVRLFILFVHTLFVLLLFDNQNDSIDFFNWKIGPKFLPLTPPPPLPYGQPGRFFYDSPKIFFHQGG